MARKVEKRQCETLEELQDCIATAWDEVDKEYMKTLAHSMPARCAAVIQAAGWHTKY
jgi:hypothetical protein